jgi:hypothetical protein
MGEDSAANTFYSVLNTGQWTTSSKPVIPTVIHYPQNHLQILWILIQEGKYIPWKI